MRRTVAIIGGGITGLAAASWLQSRMPAVRIQLLESRDRLGGVLQTTRTGGFLIEAAADGFLVNPPSAVELCRRLGLEDSLIATNEKGRRALVVCRGRLQPIPDGFTIMAPSRLTPLLRTPILSTAGKLRAGLEAVIPRGGDAEDESLARFVERRFGRELLDRLIQPLISGIYTGDLERLSVEATMPRLRRMEQQHGSLLRAMLAQRRKPAADAGSGARYGQFATLRDGMSTLVDALARRLPQDAIQLSSPVSQVMLTGDGRWRIQVGGSQARRLDVDGLVVATPSYRAAELLGNVDPPLAAELAKIEYASCAIASLGYRRTQVGAPLDGFGFVAPLIEKRNILSCSYASLKYEGRAADDALLLRVFIGGACQSDLLQLSTPELLALAHREVAELLTIRGEPILEHLVRHHRVMPQYHVGHCHRVERIERRALQLPRFALAGNALRGVGAPACIQSGEKAAEYIAARLDAEQELSHTFCA
ncbi:MAG: protoporphyrinogen oxidase [Pirellulales bacterium]|nr:protoporphyrinogen oxidase [Pirellulales bacterium]